MYACKVLLCCIGSLILISADVTLKVYDDNDDSFSLRCQQHGWIRTLNIYWYKHPHFVIKTNWFLYDDFYVKDLERRTTISTGYNAHMITVTKNETQQPSIWVCCRYYYTYSECSNTVYVSGSSKVAGFSSTPSFSLPTVFPATRSSQYMKGNLTLSATDENVTTDGYINLTCTIDTISQSEWMVAWFQNDQPVLATFQNQSFFLNDNSTEQLESFLTGKTTFDQLSNITSPVFSDITTTTTQTQHVVTFLTSMIGTTSWRCSSPYVDDFSNPVNITVFIRTSTDRTVGSPQSAAIIAGTVSGTVVVVVVVVVLVIILLRRRKNNQNEKVVRNTDDLVIAENVLYVPGPDESQIVNRNDNAERVLQDNILYVSADSEEI